MTIKEHKELILKWLYARKSEGIVDLRKFYDEYDIDATWNEAIQIIKSLNTIGYLDDYLSKDSLGVELTANGAEYVEELSEVSDYAPKDKFSSDQQKEIAIRLDELAVRLNKLEVGQEIIYDDLLKEIETLKNLLNVLGKKDWFQQLKGKLIDQGLGQLAKAGVDVITDVFKDQNLLGN
ncbi:MAG: hypothetical protein AAGE93_14955 [Bacteroidota bacterium]